MSQDYSKDGVEETASKDSAPVRKRNWWMLLVLPAWVALCFFVAQVIVAIPIVVFSALSVSNVTINTSVLSAVVAALVYLIALFLVVIPPYKYKKIKTTRENLGLTRLPSWMDILVIPAGFVVYILISALFILLATNFLPGFDVDQAQDVGFSGLSQRFEYILAFLTLVIIAPLAEEILFRGYLFGKLKEYVPAWIAIIATSVLFGVIHGTWNVAIDTFALGVVLCVLREITGSIWASVLLHMVKNGIAFYILFIYPTFLTTLVK